MKLFFSIKGLNTNNMMLVEKYQIVREEEIIAHIMNNYFTNIRGGCRGLQLLPMQHPEIAHININS